MSARTESIRVGGATLQTCGTSRRDSRSDDWTVVTGVSGSPASRRWRATSSTTMQAPSSPRAAAQKPRWSAASRSGSRRRRPRARGRPDADRQDAALPPGDLRRHLGRGSGACSPAPPRRGCAAGPPGVSRSTPATAAARPAKARAHATIEMSFCRREAAVRQLRRQALQRRDPCRSPGASAASPTCWR